MFIGRFDRVENFSLENAEKILTPLLSSELFIKDLLIRESTEKKVIAIANKQDLKQQQNGSRTAARNDALDQRSVR
ncbi:MAG: hypothetical protein R6U96_10925 [Promethearchaeia archaeon]